jgi:hypothetical protein
MTDILIRRGVRKGRGEGQSGSTEYRDTPAFIPQISVQHSQTVLVFEMFSTHGKFLDRERGQGDKRRYIRAINVPAQGMVHYVVLSLVVE